MGSALTGRVGLGRGWRGWNGMNGDKKNENIIYRQQIYSLDFQALSLAQGVKGHTTIYTSEGESLEIEATCH